MRCRKRGRTPPVDPQPLEEGLTPHATCGFANAAEGGGCAPPLEEVLHAALDPLPLLEWWPRHTTRGGPRPVRIQPRRASPRRPPLVRALPHALPLEVPPREGR